MEPSVILVVDDERSVQTLFTTHFRKAIKAGTYRFLFAHGGEDALLLLEAHPEICLVLLDIKMPGGMDGLEMLRTIHRKALLNTHLQCVKVIMVTVFDDLPNIRAAIRYGVADYIAKPLDFEKLEQAMQRVLEETARRREADLFVGDSEPIRRLKDQIRQMAEYPVNVLIHGETGAGKSLLAKLIHHSSPRAEGPFVDVHCGAIPANLVESELFGHVKGAFTGAARQHTGKFQLADGGTLFLDEISTLDIELQAKLLKVLDNKTFFPVGSDNTVQVDVRLIAAANESLPELVQAKRFREDLYYRLKVVTLTIPPLRDRRSDISLLANHLLTQLNAKYHTDKTLAPGAVTLLTRAPWPGNVRELAHTLEQAVLLCPDNIIQAQDLPADILQGRQCSPTSSAVNPFSVEDWMERLLEQDINALQEVQRLLLRVTWQHYQGNKSLIAERLGMSRGRVYRLLHQYHIE
ncbi:MAG: sigma-54 dependent transcriptional regulator [Candidatus Vecturithrix sp.]|jgi:DNA-binding NtrC family response regulator|nr:sigma-54 dependent transcriptional regulator [Candidatus Vecturithrix sp.]